MTPKFDKFISEADMMMRMPAGGDRFDALDKLYQKKYFPIPTKRSPKWRQEHYLKWIKMKLNQRHRRLERELQKKNKPKYIEPEYNPGPRNPVERIA